jgi:Arc/MetJ-type ribon-helix-helix transcriptional regulator
MLKRKVESGMYNSVDDASATALCLLDDWDEMQDSWDAEEIRKMIQEGLDSGPALPGREVFARLRERADEQLRQER